MTTWPFVSHQPRAVDPRRVAVHQNQPAPRARRDVARAAAQPRRDLGRRLGRSRRGGVGTRAPGRRRRRGTAARRGAAGVAARWISIDACRRRRRADRRRDDGRPHRSAHARAQPPLPLGNGRRRRVLVPKRAVDKARLFEKRTLVINVATRKPAASRSASSDPSPARFRSMDVTPRATSRAEKDSSVRGDVHAGAAPSSRRADHRDGAVRLLVARRPARPRLRRRRSRVTLPTRRRSSMPLRMGRRARTAGSEA